jgi:hypothetical protein
VLARGPDLRRLAERLVGEHGLTERSNTFDKRAVLQESAKAAGQGARVADVRGRGDRFIGRDDVLSAAGGEMTTVDQTDCERRLIYSA